VKTCELSVTKKLDLNLILRQWNFRKTDELIYLLIVGRRTSLARMQMVSGSGFVGWSLVLYPLFDTNTRSFRDREKREARAKDDEIDPGAELQVELPQTSRPLSSFFTRFTASIRPVCQLAIR
jgi:hypothetical protein